MSPSYVTTEQRDPDRVPLQDILKAVEGTRYPVEKENLANLARRHDAPDPVLEAIRRLPKGRLDSEADLRQAYESMKETRDARSTPTGKGRGEREMADEQAEAEPRTPKPETVSGTQGTRSERGTRGTPATKQQAEGEPSSEVDDPQEGQPERGAKGSRGAGAGEDPSEGEPGPKQP